MAVQERDLISVLVRDHREVQELFRRLQNGGTPDERRRIADEATIELVRHSVAEDMYLYPEVRKALPEGDRIADRELEDHREIERTLKELEKVDAISPEFDTLITRLTNAVQRHIDDEENVLFPRLLQHIDHDDLVKLGRKVESAKDRAPTRPHPNAPDSPGLLKVLAPGAGLVDRIRDQLSGRGRHKKR